MPQVLKVTALVLAVIFAGMVVLGLGVAAVNWLNGSGEADVAPPATAADASVSQAAPGIEAAPPCGADSAASALVCEAEGTATSLACDTAVPAAPPTVAVAPLQAPAIDRAATAQTKTATFALG
jgi:hypothetical protein